VEKIPSKLLENFFSEFFSKKRQNFFLIKEQKVFKKFFIQGLHQKV